MSRKTAARSAPWFRSPSSLPPKGIKLGVDPYTGKPVDADTGERVADIAGLKDCVEKYRELKAEISRLEAQAKTYRAPLEAAMGEATLGVVGTEGVLTWRYRPRQTADLEKLKRKYPEAYAECVKETASRFFVVK